MAGTTLIGYPAPLDTLTPSGTGSERNATGQRLARAPEGRSPRSTASGRAALERPRGPSGKSRLPARAGLWGRRNPAGELEPGSWHVADAEADETDLVPARARPSGRAILAVGVCVGLGVLGALATFATFATRPPVPGPGVNAQTPAVAPAEPVRTIVPAPEPRPVRAAGPATASPGAAPSQPAPSVAPPRQTPAAAPAMARPSVATPAPPPRAAGRAARGSAPIRPSARPRPAASQPELDPDAVLEPTF